MMNYIRSFFARTIYIYMAAGNKMIYRFRCSNSKQNARKNPDFFCDRASKLVAGFLAFIERMAEYILEKLIYICFFMCIPYLLINTMSKNGNFPYEITMAYFFIIMNVLFGSFVNPHLYRFDKKEKKFLALLPARNFFVNRLVMGMAADAVASAIALCICNVGFWRYGMWISIAAALIRPLGEFVTYVVKNSAFGKKGYGSFTGVLMAIAVLIAYVLPFIDKTCIQSIWFFYGIFFKLLCPVIAAASLCAFVLLPDFGSLKKEILNDDYS